MKRTNERTNDEKGGGGKRWKKEEKGNRREEGTQIQRDRLSGDGAVRVPCLQPFNCVYLHG